MAVFLNGNYGTSATYTATDIPDLIYQHVDLGDTPHSDGNWESNMRTVSVEHHGDWRNGYDNPVVRENSAKLSAWLIDQGIVSYPIRHRDVKPTTQCSADLPVEAIWNRAKEIVHHYRNLDARPEWMKNRREVPAKMVYGQINGLFVHNLTAPGTPLDTRRFALNQNFEVKGETTVGGKHYWITRSSFDANIASGLLKSEVADQPFVPVTPQPSPTPPKPTTPDWADSLLVDEANREMYVLRATPLIDLENGHPVIKDGKQVWFNAGDIIKDVSAHTIVSGVTYQLTEYSYVQTLQGNWKVANGIKASDLTIDPKATPVGTPANPGEPEKPTTPVEQMPDVPTQQPPAPQPTEPTPAPAEPTPSAPTKDRQVSWLTKLLLFIIQRLSSNKK